MTVAVNAFIKRIGEHKKVINQSKVIYIAHLKSIKVDQSAVEK